MKKEFDMEEYIDKRMLEIQSLDERILYKEIVGDLLKKIYQYSEESYHELEQRILNESSPRQSDYAIYLTLTDRAHYDATDTFMFAMDLQSTVKKEISYEDLECAVKNHERMKLYTVFLQTSASNLYRILHEDRKFQGMIKTENREYRGTFFVEQNENYLDMIKNLYDIFMVNYQPWTTVCEAYLAKMIDVCLYEVEEMGPKEIIQEVRVDFEEYAGLVRYDMIPLWNLKQIREKTSTYPDPAIDKINYEHMIFSHRLNEESEYLVMNTDIEIIHIRREKNRDLKITCPADTPREWQLYEVNKPWGNEKYPYPVLSNQYKESFSGQITEMFRKSIKTKAEMARLIESFSYQGYLEFRDFLVTEEEPREWKASNYNMDGFMIDEIRVGGFRQFLLLRFAPAESECYLNEDIMSFLVSQVQKIFPEYQCIGKLI